ncbi:MAG: threonylcarbamoyl-AMP synthase, partial [Daejeonella sp.]|nr:threonylcarbamoyl-AMP synthase [Daejeonella sp.]
FDNISPDILNGVDLIVDFEQDSRSEGKPSTIMKLEADGKFKFIRK